MPAAAPLTTPPAPLSSFVAHLAAHDGTQLAVVVYQPAGTGPFPALFAASPYRFDNNLLPAQPPFLFRETGPIAFYLSQGYAYVHLDVRGTGRSGGEFEFLGPYEQRDYFDVIEWVGAQPWCTGKVGSIGESYCCMAQWLMGVQRPPALACIGAFDGMNDPYRSGVYQDGLLTDFFPGRWWYQARFINLHPASGAASRALTPDLTLVLLAHPFYDEYWRVRCAWERLADITVPVYSLGVWVKGHNRGNVEGFRRVSGPAKLRVVALPTAAAAFTAYASVAFHQRTLLPFYDHYLKGLATDYSARPAVEYQVRGSQAWGSAPAWPLPGTQYQPWYLHAGPSGSVTSLNDGGLAPTAFPEAEPPTPYAYPQEGWQVGVVGFGPDGPPSGFDPARRVLTFTSAPLAHDLVIAVPLKLGLYVSSTNTDTDVFVKVQDQFPQAAAERAKDLNPPFEHVTKGWLRASHRALDPVHSTEQEPYQLHAAAEPLVPGQVYYLEISLEPMAYHFAAGHRLRLDLANGDSTITDPGLTHSYPPSSIGTDTIYHSAQYSSHLLLPVQPAAASASASAAPPAP